MQSNKTKRTEAMKKLLNKKNAFLVMKDFIKSESEDCKDIENIVILTDIDTNVCADGTPTNEAKWVFWKSIADNYIRKQQLRNSEEKLLTYEQAFQAMTFFLKGKYDDDPLGLFSEVAKEINDYMQNQNPGLTKNDDTWDYWLRCCEESLKYELNYD